VNCNPGSDPGDCAGCGDLSTISGACPQSGPGAMVPSTCPEACAATFLPWWLRCHSGQEVKHDF
jgi:hypothetical protein